MLILKSDMGNDREGKLIRAIMEATNLSKNCIDVEIGICTDLPISKLNLKDFGFNISQEYLEDRVHLYLDYGNMITIFNDGLIEPYGGTSFKLLIISRDVNREIIDKYLL